MAASPLAKPFILTLKPISDWARSEIEKIHSGTEVRIWDGHNDSVLRKATIFWGDPRPWWPLILIQTPSLQWLHTPRAGVDDLIDGIREFSHIALTCGKGEVAGPGLAEHALALLMALSRGLRTSLRCPRWLPKNEHPQAWEWRGKKVGLLGGGGTANALKPVMLAMGAGFEVIRRHPNRQKTNYEFGPEELLSRAQSWDAVVVALPGTTLTRGWLGENFFAHLKPGAVLVNVGRGDVVNQEALLGALQSGKLAGAGLDVTDPEPLPATDPLWAMPQVLITSHTAGLSDQRNLRNEGLMIENFSLFHQGQPLRNQICPLAGY